MIRHFIVAGATLPLRAGCVFDPCGGNEYRRLPYPLR